MSQSQIARLGRLLWMRYKPSELADELGCSVDTIYKSYVPSGCPHQRDEETSAIWIVGTEFAEWARKVVVKHKVKTGMGRDQAYCVKCHKTVDVVGLTAKPFTAQLEMVGGTCSECGSKVHRARTRQ